MRIKMTVGEGESKTTGNVKYENKQKVNFLYVITTTPQEQTEKERVQPSKKPYATTGGVEGLASLYPKNGLILMNYNAGGRIDPSISNYRQYGIMTVPQSSFVNAVAIYKKEIWYEKTGQYTAEPDAFGRRYPIVEPREEKNWHLVATSSENGTIYDFNIGNHRYYKYLYRFVSSNNDDTIKGDSALTEGLKEITAPIKVVWDGWSLTELHEVPYTNGKQYAASLRDVWKFRYNISPGDFTQNTSKTSQETLAKFPKFIHGPKDNISSSVSCLLGRDVFPSNIETYSYEYEKNTDGTWGWDVQKFSSPVETGGYQERLWTGVDYIDATSNKQADMLKHWRNFCYSGNPKLFKDNQGHHFIVQIHDASYHVEENWNSRPIMISFSWTQIADADDVIILQEIE